MIAKRLAAFSLAAVLAATAPAPAFAYTELPQPVAAMLDDAIASGSEAEVVAVAKYARKALPGQEAEIDARLSAYKAKLAAAAAATRAAPAEAPAAADGFFENWSGKGELGGFLAAGNSDTKGLAAALQLTRESTHWRVRFNANADYQRSNGATSTERFIAAVEPNYKFDEHLFVYGLAQYERDPIQGYDARYVVSGGVGYSPVSKENFKLDLKAGPAWRRTHFINMADENSLTGLGSANMLWKLSPTLSLHEAASVLMQSDKSTLTALTALDAKLNGFLSARLSYQVRHETNPLVGINSTDTLSRMTLVYDF